MASAPSGATAMWWYIRIGTRVSRTFGRVGDGNGRKRVGLAAGVRFAGSSAVGVSVGALVTVAAGSGGSVASGSTMSITAVTTGCGVAVAVTVGASDDAIAGAQPASRHSSPIHTRSFFTALRFAHTITIHHPAKKRLSATSLIATSLSCSARRR